MNSMAAQHRMPAQGASRAERAAGGLADCVLRILLLLYLMSMVLEGPLRYGLSVAGLPNVLYLRDVVPVGSIAFLFARRLWTDRSVDLRIAIPLAVLLGHATLAVIAGVDLFPVLFGLKIFLFIPYGIAMWPLVQARFGAALAAAAFIYAITLAGVGANFLLERMPWEGLAYDTAFGPTSTTREWWMGAIRRLPGLARTSFNAAMILGITGLLTAIRFPSWPLRVALTAATLLGIIATTSKGMVLAYALAAAWLLIDPEARRPLASRVLVGALAALSIVMPTLIVLLDLGSSLKLGSLPDLLTSVWDRFATMWPAAFEILPEGPAAVLGAGLGSIGTPQEYGSKAHLANAADSLAIYMIVNFGLLGVLYFLLPAIALPSVQRLNDRRIQQAFTIMLLVAYGYGLSVNMLEDAFFSICIGMAVGSAWPWRAQASLAPSRSATRALGARRPPSVGDHMGRAS